MTQSTRMVPAVMAVMAAASIGILYGKTAWAQAVTPLSARVIADNIPGASAVSQVGTFLNDLAALT